MGIQQNSAARTAAVVAAAKALAEDHSVAAAAGAVGGAAKNAPDTSAYDGANLGAAFAAMGRWWRGPGGVVGQKDPAIPAAAAEKDIPPPKAVMASPPPPPPGGTARTVGVAEPGNITRCFVLGVLGSLAMSYR